MHSALVLKKYYLVFKGFMRNAALFCGDASDWGAGLACQRRGRLWHLPGKTTDQSVHTLLATGPFLTVGGTRLGKPWVKKY